jgi:hypothetical protein
MEKLWVALGVEGRLVEDGWPGPDRLLPAGHLLGHCEILFAKIEDEAIARERERLSTLPAEG